MKKSKYAHILKIKEGTYALYNALVFEPLFADQDFIYRFEREELTEEERITLKEYAILADEFSDKAAEDMLFGFVKDHYGKINMMYLLVTTECNLNCKYCFIEQNPESTDTYRIMDLKVAKIAIDKFATEISCDKKEAQILIYGGEPLLNRNILVDVISYIRSKLPDAQLSIITNGTLVDEEIVDLLKKYNVGVGISLDGPSDITDKNRVFKNKSDSVYKIARNKIDILSKYDVNYCISLTITQDVLDNQDRVLKWLKELPAKNVFFNLYHFSKEEIANRVSWQGYYEALSSFILRANDELNIVGKRDGRVDELNDLFLKHVFRIQSCGAQGLNQIAVLPDGSVTICHGDSRKRDEIIGNIIHENISEIISKTEKWKDLYTIDHYECLQCEALYVCGGGCPQQSKILFNDAKAVDKSACVFYKSYLKWLLSHYYDRSEERG